MLSQLIDHIIEEFFFLGCFAWSVHRIGIAASKIAIERFSKKKPFLIPEIFLCGRCFSFWAALVLSFNPVTASVVAVMVQFIESVFVYLGSKTPLK